MAAIVSIVSRHGLRNEVRHRKQLNESKLALFKPLLHFYNYLKQLYMSDKTDLYYYKGGCGMCGHTCIEEIKRAGLGYR